LERGVRPIGALVDVDHLVEQVEADDFVVRRRFGGRAVEVARGGGVQRVVDQRRLARAGNAGDAGQQADRQFQRDVLEVVAARADDASAAARRIGRSRLCRAASISARPDR
jgi:hypothetical protein